MVQGGGGCCSVRDTSRNVERRFANVREYSHGDDGRPVLRSIAAPRRGLVDGIGLIQSRSLVRASVAINPMVTESDITCARQRRHAP
jgi:hypothetical protein